MRLPHTALSPSTAHYVYSMSMRKPTTVCAYVLIKFNVFWFFILHTDVRRSKRRAPVVILCLFVMKSANKRRETLHFIDIIKNRF